MRSQKVSLLYLLEEQKRGEKPQSDMGVYPADVFGLTKVENYLKKIKSEGKNKEYFESNNLVIAGNSSK